MKATLAVGLGIAAALILASRNARASDAPYSENGATFDMSNADQNVSAFLAMIRRAEGGTDDYDYDDLYGGGNFTDFSDHPAITGEWPGVRLAYGPNAGKLTTAAGAYQITRTTWIDLGGAARFGGFHPAAQDAAALALLERRGALPMIEAGKFADAVQRLRGEWEAFDKMFAGTYPFTLADAQAYYTANGGAVV